MNDVHIALRAIRFVGIGDSNASAMISLMKPWPAGSCDLVGASALLYRNGSIYLAKELSELAMPDRVLCA